MNARSLTVNGGRGPRWNVTRSWMLDQRIKSIVHFQPPVLRGEEIRLEVERVWPGKCIPLMRDRVSDNFTFRFSNLMPVKAVE